MQACSRIVPRFQFSFFLNQGYCSGRSWLEGPFSIIAGVETNSPMLAKISRTEKKSNWHYGELMAVGLMALSSLWVRKVPGSTPGDARFVVEYDANRVFDLYIVKWKKSTSYTDVWLPFISFLVSVGSIEHHSCESQQIIAGRKSYRQVYSCGLYTSIDRTIQTW